MLLSFLKNTRISSFFFFNRLFYDLY